MVISNHSKEKSNCANLCHKRRSITLVKSINLHICFGRQPNFKAINFTTEPNFNNISPSIQREEEQAPINHGLSLSRMVKCLMNSFRKILTYEEETKEE